MLAEARHVQMISRALLDQPGVSGVFLPASSRLLRLPPASSRWAGALPLLINFSRTSAGLRIAPVLFRWLTVLCIAVPSLVELRPLSELGDCRFDTSIIGRDNGCPSSARRQLRASDLDWHEDYHLDQKPFSRLPTVRRLANDDLPAGLADFYTLHEGVGLESSPDRLVRLCRLNEVTRMTWSDLHIFGDDQLPGWESFSAFRVGVSAFFDDIVCVCTGPCAPAGSILAFGVDVMGPGGNGPFPFECSLVLAPTFSDWLRRLEGQAWMEYGLCPGDIAQLPRPRQHEQLAYYRSLNPNMDWADVEVRSKSKPWWKFW